MRMPWYKRWLSYLFDIPIDHREGTVNKVLKLYLVRGRYQLCTANAIYSFADLYDNFYTAFKKANWDMLKGDRVLLLGFGLGSIPWMLEKNFKKAFRYTAVEPDLEVLDLFKTYVLDELHSPVQIYTVGADAFLASASQVFDLICMDVFVDDVIPEHMLEPAYLDALKTIMAEGGVILYNCLYKSKADKLHTDLFFTDVFQVAFPEAYALDARGNLILISNRNFISSPGNPYTQ